MSIYRVEGYIKMWQVPLKIKLKNACWILLEFFLRRSIREVCDFILQYHLLIIVSVTLLSL